MCQEMPFFNLLMVFEKPDTVAFFYLCDKMFMGINTLFSFCIVFIRIYMRVTI